MAPPLERSARRVQRSWAVVLLGVLTLLLTLVPIPSSAQAPLATSAAEAPVVVDGRVLFKVRNFGNFTAAERVAIINANLAQEVRSPKPADIQVIQEDQLAIVRSQTSGNHLLTVTKEDVISGASTLSQARFWRDAIAHALQQGQLERTPAYYHQALLFSLGVSLGAIAVHFGLRFLSRWVSRKLTHWLREPALPLHPQRHPAKLFLQLAILGLQIGLWTAVAFYITDLFPQTRSWRYNLFKFLTSPIVTLGESNYSALQLLLLVGFTVGLWFGVGGLTRLFRFYVLSRTGADLRVQEVIAVLTQYVLTFLGLIVLLQIWGLDVRSLAIIASVLGVGIGFGVQNITNNLISGLIITLERPIQVGDFVKVGELVGIVERIGARSTEVRTLDQVTIIVPNSRFLETEVINWSHGDPVSRLRLTVPVAYGSDIERVQAALLEAAKGHPDVLVRPQPQVWFQGFGDSALNFDLLVWTGEPQKQYRVKSDIYYCIEASLRRHNIEVPFPQRDLNLRSPQLEEFIMAWLGQRVPMPSETGDTSAERLSFSNTNQFSKYSQHSPVVTSTESVSEQYLATAPSGKQVTDVEIEELVTAMRGSGGIEIKDRRYRQNLYPACFIASEAVEWLVQQKNCTREEAIALGQLLMNWGIIHHVWDERLFQDGYFFYRFSTEEQ